MLACGEAELTHDLNMENFFQIMGALILAFGYAAYRLYVKPYPPEQTIDSPSVPLNYVEMTETTTPPITTPTEAHSAPETKSRATLENLCLAIRDFEGKPGDQNYRLNNPGNARYHAGGYAKMYGEVGKSKNGFAIFKTYDLGWLYLRNMIKGQIKKRPDQTLLQFMTRYAPESDNNPTTAYAKFIGKRLGVDISFRMGDLVLV